MSLGFLKKGRIQIEVIVFNREQLINALWNHGVKVHNVKKIDASTVIMEINYEAYKEVKEIVNRLQGKITIISAQGGIFIISKMKKRIGLVVGITLFVLILLYLSNFIWRVEIETKRYLAPYEVRQQLKELGIMPGIKKNSLNVYSLEKTMENINGDIMWVNARIEGSALKIKIEEKINPPLKVEETKVSNVIATMDGEIKKIYTISGTAAVKPGSIVKRGDVLIFPYEGSAEHQYEVTAKGRVVANTFYEKSMEVQVEGIKEERTNNKDEEIYLEFENKKIYLKKPTKSFENYDKIEESGKYLHRDTYYEKVNKEITETKEDIINRNVDYLYNATMKEVTKQAKLIEKIVTTEDISEGKILLKVVFIIEQDIAVNY